MIAQWQELKETIIEMRDNDGTGTQQEVCKFLANLMDILEKQMQEPKTGWNNHQIACMLADLFGDACACNYNGIDEWLGELCDFKDSCCPNPVGVACWEQFLKYSQSRYTECGYEVRDDKNALRKPKTGHWEWVQYDGNPNIGNWHCSECRHIAVACVNKNDKGGVPTHKYCPNCGAKMEEVEVNADE